MAGRPCLAQLRCRHSFSHCSAWWLTLAILCKWRFRFRWSGWGLRFCTSLPGNTIAFGPKNTIWRSKAYTKLVLNLICGLLISQEFLVMVILSDLAECFSFLSFLLPVNPVKWVGTSIRYKSTTWGMKKHLVQHLGAQPVRRSQTPYKNWLF